MPLELTANNGNGAAGGVVRDVPMAERLQMTALDVLRHAMRGIWRSITGSAPRIGR
jgi:hypothetical protein